MDKTLAVADDLSENSTISLRASTLEARAATWMGAHPTVELYASALERMAWNEALESWPP